MIRSIRTIAAVLGLTTAVALGGAGVGGFHTGAREPTLSVGQTVSGELTTSDDVEDLHYRADHYALALRAGERVRVIVRETSFDPWLRVTGPDGLHAVCDDVAPGTHDAMVQLVAPESGTYRVSVVAAVPDQLGSYRVAVEASPALPGEPLVLGRDAHTTLGQHADPILPGQSSFHFSGDGGALARIRLGSSTITPVAVVLGPRGERWMRESTASSAELVFALPESGEYEMLVTSLSGDGGAEVDIETEVHAPVVADDDLEPSGHAGPRAEGRVIGVFAGESLYPDMPPLYGAADDARFLAEALRAAHVESADQQRVLVDAEVTHDALLSAVEAAVERTSPDDVLLFFFAGHGDLVEGESAVLTSDGSVRASELADVLSTSRAGLTMIAIDACHSGGFADRVIDVPGRVGLFSSDGDAISDTAEVHRAGGYVSWYLRRGMLGEADAAPRDGLLTLGELTDYVHRGFARDEATINPPHQLGPGQHLIVRRNAAAWDEPLWLYPRTADLALPSVPALALESPPA